MSATGLIRDTVFPASKTLAVRAISLARPSLVPLVLSTALLTVYLSTLAPGVTWANSGADSGDLITAAATLGIAHPTGYPAYLILARLFQFLPIGTLAYRSNLLSAVAAAVAAGLVCDIVRRAHGGSVQCGLLGGLIAGLAFGLSPLVWSQAVIAEVYALHALFIAVLLRGESFMVRAGETERRARPADVIFGLALGNHATVAFLLPPWLALRAWRPPGNRWRKVLFGLLGVAAGSLVYLYLPLRAAAQPPVNWGNAATWEGFWWVISAAPYHRLAFGLPTAYLAARLKTWAGLLSAQFGWLGLTLALVGLLFGRSRSWRIQGMAAWLMVVFSIFAIGYNTLDWHVNLIPAVMGLAIGLGLGLSGLLEAVSRRGRWLAAPLAALFLLTLLINAARSLPGVDASRDHRAEDFARRVLAEAPPHTMVFTNGDTDTFPLWYFQLALGQRRDLVIVVKGLLVYDWYREVLVAQYGALVLPDSMSDSSWKTRVGDSNGRPVCETLPHSAEVLVCKG